jgi:hypothetical protein
MKRSNMSKTGLTALILLSTLNVFGQTWVSLARDPGYTVNPTKEFKIDPYRNDLWFVSDNHATVLESDGDMYYFNSTDFAGATNADELSVGFTQNHNYFSLKNSGIYWFDNYSQIIKSAQGGVIELISGQDTIFFHAHSNCGFSGFVPESTLISEVPTAGGFNEIKIKNGQTYVKVGNDLAHPLTSSSNQTITGGHYLGGVLSDFSFTNNTNTLYAASNKGITVCENYVAIDSLTPFNTGGMPSNKVLELEFDADDNLWALFGDDVSYEPMSIAMLDAGNFWINEITASNSPIDFPNFVNFEFDTLGNMWVVDDTHLHSMETATSPSWLGNESLSLEEINFELFPNPSDEFITLSFSENVNTEELSVIITDLSGKTCYQGDFEATINHGLTSGAYIITVREQFKVIATERFVVK